MGVNGNKPHNCFKCDEAGMGPASPHLSAVNLKISLGLKDLRDDAQAGFDAILPARRACRGHHENALR